MKQLLINDNFVFKFLVVDLSSPCSFLYGNCRTFVSYHEQFVF